MASAEQPLSLRIGKQRLRYLGKYLLKYQAVILSLTENEFLQLEFAKAAGQRAYAIRQREQLGASSRSILKPCGVVAPTALLA